jgi:tetratricopeptide (TPR) repeat protein
MMVEAASRRLLLPLIAVELALLGGLVGWRWLRPAAVLPAAITNDPLLGPEIAALARRAERGAAADWLALGEALLGQGHYRHAEAAFRRAASLDPASLDACYGLAYCLDRTGRMAESNPHYRRCRDLADPRHGNPPKRGVALYEIGRNHLREGNLVAAEETFREHPGFWAADFQLAKLLLHSGRPKEAGEIVDRLLLKLPLALELHQLRARIKEAVGTPRAAVEASVMEERSAHLIETNYSTVFVQPFTVRHGLGRLLKSCKAAVDTGDVALAADRLAAIDAGIAGRAVPERAQAEMLRARIAVAAGRPEAAIEAIAAERRRGRHDPDLAGIEADALDALGRSDEADAIRERLVQVAPAGDLWATLAAAAERAGDGRRRDECLARAAFQEGLAAYRRNDLPGALRSFKQATQLAPTFAAAWHRRGEVAWHLGDTDEAAESLRRAIELRPSADRSRELLSLVEPVEAEARPGTR